MTGKNQSGLLEENGLRELPVIMMLLEVTANAGQKIGTLVDLASDTNYITHEAADKLKLRSKKITLVVHGIGRMAIKTVGGAHPDLFDEIDVGAHKSRTHFARSMRTATVKYEEIVESPEVQAENEIVRPHQETVTETKNTATSNREFLEWWKWDSIGAACEPKCGGCCCGSCQPGGKEMTLVEERELETIKEGLTYVKEDAPSESPHWDARYPWIENPASLSKNRSGVEATFLRTEKQLKKETEWQAVYAAEVHARDGGGDETHQGGDKQLERTGVDREVHLHRFLWRDTQDEEIDEYAITRVNIGDRPAECIAQLTMRETARLAKFGPRVLEEDSYVDDVLTSQND
ncbi:hypothetical protein SKAU_G00095870 [Synaphobranchus kaupii]|uniref:Uncharacterized protein n=1 Tax=Synaphobranchus kaupii TaxID=118154 RepID=A0A9Q1J6N1_SYNKA|nr:hypothetical protein SKAU_G00095870 [Synaphobranchus kaupii]